MATVVVNDAGTTPVDIASDTESKVGSVYTLDGGVVIHYRDRVVEADHIEYDEGTQDLTATGHLHVTGGKNHEEIRASHGTVNLKTQVGRFYDVTGSVGVKTRGQAADVCDQQSVSVYRARGGEDGGGELRGA